MKPRMTPNCEQKTEEFQAEFKQGRRRYLLIKLGIIAGVCAVMCVLSVFLLRIDLKRRTTQLEREGWSVSYSKPNSGNKKEQSTLELATLYRTVLRIREDYVDQNRIDAREMIAQAMLQVELVVDELLVDIERDQNHKPQRVTLRLGEKEREFFIEDHENLWEITFNLRDLLTFVSSELKRPELDQRIEYAAIDGLLSTLDPHSMLLRPEGYRQMREHTQGQFGGVGLTVTVEDDALVVVKPIPDTPAAKAGIRAGDRIVQIGPDCTDDMALDDAVDALRGEPGTEIEIWLSRPPSETPRKYKLKRAMVHVDSVTGSLLPGRVAYCKISTFQSSTSVELRETLQKLRGRGKLNGVILDLRDNPGGLLDQAIKVADLFIESGPIVTTVGNIHRRREPKLAHKEDTESRSPLVVLLNRESASASEIVGGALKNHHRALVLGQRSFGKGSVQVVYDNPDGSALKLTIAQYLTPGDLSIQSVGISPDIELVPLTLTARETDLYRSLDAASQDGGERNLKAHLDHETSHVAAMEEPRFTFSYLVTPESDSKDFAVELARELIQGSERSDNPFDAAQERAEALQEIQNINIFEALGDIGVDWRAPDEEDSIASGEAKFFTLKDSFTAGETVQLRATITNTGDSPLTRVHALTRSDNPALNGREFLFGHIKKGESKDWQVSVTLPTHGLSRRDPVSLEFFEAKDSVLSVEPIDIEVHERKAPVFAADFVLDDRKTNGDGRLQPDEEVELKVRVKNVGEGDAQSLLALLENVDTRLWPVMRDPDLPDAPPPSAKILRGRIQVGVLKADDELDLTFRLRLTPESYLDSHLELRLVLQDRVTRKGMVHAIRLPIDERVGEPLPERAFEPQPPRIPAKIIFDEPPPLTIDKPILHLSGHVEHASELRGLSVFVGEKKIAFWPNKQGADLLNFSFDLPLKMGQNQIAILGRRDRAEPYARGLYCRRTR